MIIRKSYSKRIKLSKNKSVGLLILNVLLLAILILWFSKLQQQEIIRRFVAEYGFYGQSLSLKKDQHFIHRYFGCSQSRGINKGTYLIQNNTLVLQLEDTAQRAILSESYLITESNLIPTDSNQVFRSVHQYGYW